jgi:hypothetical protein
MREIAGKKMDAMRGRNTLDNQSEKVGRAACYGGSNTGAMLNLQQGSREDIHRGI